MVIAGHGTNQCRAWQGECGLPSIALAFRVCDTQRTGGLLIGLDAIAPRRFLPRGGVHSTAPLLTRKEPYECKLLKALGPSWEVVSGCRAGA